MYTTQAHLLARLAVGSTFLTSVPASAQATGGPSLEERTPPGANRPPEQPAIDSCRSKKEGERVTFVDGEGKQRRWVCVYVSGVLAARSGIATAAYKVKDEK